MNDVSIPLDGRYQPPLANGEVVFDQPWQGRVFGLAILLAEQDTFQWSDLQQSLIDVVAEWDNETDGRSGDYPYYELFAEALSRLMVAIAPNVWRAWNAQGMAQYQYSWLGT